MPEFIPDDRAPARMTQAERRDADRQALEAGAEYGRRRRAGEIRDAGCDSVAAFLARNPSAAAAVEREQAVQRRAE